MDLGLKSRLALVTGSTAGIGSPPRSRSPARARRSSSTGARSAASTRRRARIRAERPGAEVSGVAADLARRRRLRGCVAERVPERRHPGQQLGIFEPQAVRARSPTTTGCASSRPTCSAACACRAHYVPAMRARDWGRIVFVSSESAVQIPAEMIHYGMTKTAQLAVARGPGRDAAPAPASPSTACCPGRPLPKASAASSPQLAARARRRRRHRRARVLRHARPSSLLQRFATPDEVAR